MLLYGRRASNKTISEKHRKREHVLSRIIVTDIGKLICENRIFLSFIYSCCMIFFNRTVMCNNG
jgi:hypothetical protein